LSKNSSWSQTLIVYSASTEITILQLRWHREEQEMTVCIPILEATTRSFAVQHICPIM